MGTHDKEIQSGVHTGLGGKPEEEGEGQEQTKETKRKGKREGDRKGIQKYERDDRHGESKDQRERGCFQQATARDVPGPETVFLTVPKTDRRPAPREQGGGDALGRLGLTRNERALRRSCYRHNSVTHGNADLKTGCVNE